MILLLIFTLLLFGIELLYFKIADQFNIIDHPNHRSSHTKITIRGGGIIFSLAILISSVNLGFQYSYFLLGLFLISLISFIDDVKTISSGLRIVFHLVAVGLLFYQTGFYSLPFYLILAGTFVIIGTINAINFMDGINGITGVYGLVTLLTLYYINTNFVQFTSTHLLLVSIASVVVFMFFNFRTRAKCFAGDVGSVSLAFIILFFLIQLLLLSAEIKYVFILLIYGLDTTTTILFRIIRKEKISEAHRSHFYQFLANEKKIPHLIVALIYGLTQLAINALIIFLLPSTLYVLLIIAVAAASIFIALRFMLEGLNRLLYSKR